ncbi:MAG: hypothetical protein PHR60_07875 [Eubacteriales bacterium]|nr:hypothetical protein [Eubacteriales bacterium]
MFSQRKSFWKKGWFVFIIIGLLGLGYFLNQTPDDSENLKQSNPGYQQAGIDTPVDNPSDKEERDDPLQLLPEEDDPYYIVKELDQVISIYYCNEKGEEIFLRNTDIAYSLLSETDQALFSKGVIKYTEEELDELLQDFGS